MNSVEFYFPSHVRLADRLQAQLGEAGQWCQLK